MVSSPPPPSSSQPTMLTNPFPYQGYVATQPSLNPPPLQPS